MPAVSDHYRFQTHSDGQFLTGVHANFSDENGNTVPRAGFKPIFIAIPRATCYPVYYLDSLMQSLHLRLPVCVDPCLSDQYIPPPRIVRHLNVFFVCARTYKQFTREHGFCYYSECVWLSFGMFSLLISMSHFSAQF